MEGHQAIATRTPVACAVLLLLLFVAAGCAENPEVPNVYDRPLRPIAIVPPLGEEPIHRNQTFVVTFNTYVDIAPLTYWNTLSLSSQGVTAFGPTSYRMVDRQIVLRTTRWMEPNLVYNLMVNSEVLGSVTGMGYEGPELFAFHTDDTVQEDPDEVGFVPAWSDVEPIFDRCNECHADPEWRLTPLTFDTMVGRRSSQVDHMIVEPYQPTRSYLMHKVLWDYPIREQSGQPPAWAGYEQLSIEDQRALEAWILAGAKHE